ncbi:MAG: hypothetical protein A4E55_00543 [Pelotomaculum sp. PtaU1.Bin035]|nr:MAG: hypothetical protein A4E55_00543 [Pelotomaculum sp. PtaU1.Bin035]
MQEILQIFINSTEGMTRNLPEYAWPISAVIAWIIFFLLVDWSRLRYTIWGGVFASALQILVDDAAMKMNLYQVKTLISVLGSSVFFTFGVVFAIGVLFAQSLPVSRWLQVFNILVVVALFSVEEYLYVKIGVLKYLNWNHPASIFIDLLVFTSFTWLVEALGLNQAGCVGRGGL